MVNFKPNLKKIILLLITIFIGLSFLGYWMPLSLFVYIIFSVLEGDKSKFIFALLKAIAFFIVFFVFVFFMAAIFFDIELYYGNGVLIFCIVMTVIALLSRNFQLLREKEAKI